MLASLRSLRFLRFLSFLWFFSFLGFLSFSSTRAFAADARIRGTVVDPDGGVVAGAQVIVTAQAEIVARTDTDARGTFEISGLAAQRYVVSVVREGFRAVPVDVDLTRVDSDNVALRLQVSALSEAVVVSAAQVDLPLSRTPATTTVINRSDLETYQQETVADALQSVPGLAVARTGVEGAVTSLFSRGGESDFTAVAIDGVPVNSFGGGFDFGRLTAGSVERIEVVRGPQSALWSGAAIGGAINVITRPDAARAFDAVTSVGSRGADRFGAGAVVPFSDWRVSASGERQSSDGLNGHTFASGRVTNDDWRAEHVSAAIRREGATRIAVSGRFERSERGYPGAYGSDPGGTYFGIDTIARGRDHVALGRASISHAFSRVRPSVDLNAFRLNSDFVDSFGPTESGSRRIDVRGQTDLVLASRLSATAGVEWLGERATSTFITGPGSVPAPVKRSITSVFGELRYDAGRAFLTAGARVEAIERDRLDSDPNSFSPRPDLAADRLTAVTPRVSASWFVRPVNTAGEWTRVRASAGLGIRPPDAFEIAFSDNPGLKPERTRSGEVGVEQALTRGRILLDATFFYNRYDNLIVTVGPLLTTVSQYRSDNISNARTRGLELSASARSASGFSATAAYTFLDSEVLAIDRLSVAAPPFKVGDPLIRRPRHQGWLEGSWRGAAADVFLRLGARGRTLDVDPTFGAFGGLYPASGYTTVTAGGAFHFTRSLQVFGRVANLLDRSYEEVLGFPAAPRSAYVGLRVSVR